MSLRIKTRLLGGVVGWETEAERKAGEREMWVSGTLQRAEPLSASLRARSVKDTLRRVNSEYHTREFISVVCLHRYACHTKLSAPLCLCNTHTHTRSANCVNKADGHNSLHSHCLLLHNLAKSMWTASQILSRNNTRHETHYIHLKANRRQGPSLFIL